jgi:hypothetical protein
MPTRQLGRPPQGCGLAASSPSIAEQSTSQVGAYVVRVLRGASAESRISYGVGKPLHDSAANPGRIQLTQGSGPGLSGLHIGKRPSVVDLPDALTNELVDWKQIAYRSPSRPLPAPRSFAPTVPNGDPSSHE